MQYEYPALLSLPLLIDPVTILSLLTGSIEFKAAVVNLSFIKQG